MVDNNNRELKVVDLDSCKIGSNKAFAGRFLSYKSLIHNVEKYTRNIDQNSDAYIVPNSNTDMYCYIMIILNYLYGSNLSNISIEEFYEYLNYLEHIGVNKELIHLFSKIVVTCQNENPVYYLDLLTPEQICRAKHNVYNKVKEKVFL